MTSVKHFECLYNCGILRHVDRADYVDAVSKMDIVERKFRRGETIFFEGDTINRICIVKKGSVRAEKNYANGEVHILAVFEENSVFALEISLSKNKNAPVDYIANEQTTVLFLSIESLDKHEYRKPIKKVFVEMLADENIRMMHKIEILGERGLRDRIIVYLNVLARRFESNVVNVRMSREQMASYLCVNRSALSNELSKMRQEGIIDFSKDEFHLLDYNEDGTLK